jgi:hypothetical protein
MNLFFVGWQLYVLLFALMVVLPSFLVMGLYRFKPMWLKPMLWLLLGLTSGYLWLSWSVSQNQIWVFENRLELKAGFFRASLNGLTLPESNISVLETAELGHFSPETVVDGFNLPGYKVGWYRLQNQQLAFIMLIGEHQEITLVRTPEMVAIISGDIQRVGMIAGQPMSIQ